MQTIKKYWRELVIVLLLLALGSLAANPRIEEKEVVRTVEVERVVEKEVVKYRDRVVERTVHKPNGTTIVEKITENKKEESKEKELAQGKEEVNEKLVSAPVLSRYSLSASFDPMDLSLLNPSLTVGARLGNLPLFIEGGVTSISKDPKMELGLRLEF